MRRGSRWHGLLVAAVVLLSNEPARACVRTRAGPGGPCLYWGVRQVEMVVNQYGSDDLSDGSEFTAVERALDHWSAAACSDFTFVYGGLTSHSDVGYQVGVLDNLNLVVWRERYCRDVVPASDPCWSCDETGGECCGTRYGCWEHPRGIIAVTTTTFSRLTGALVDADIELNGVDYWFTTVDRPACDDPVSPQPCARSDECVSGERCFEGRCLPEGCVRTDVENTVTHEAGHVVGLDHSDDPVSTMYASAPEGEVDKRSLEDDDLACFCDMYPAGGPTVTCFGREVRFKVVDTRKDTRGCGCSLAGGHASGLASGLAITALLALALPLRRRRWRGPLLGVALLCAGVPHLARAHILAVPPDLDAWLLRGEVVALAHTHGAPRPCGEAPFPALMTVDLSEVLDGPASAGRVEVLVPDHHAPFLTGDALFPLVLARSDPRGGQRSPLERCARQPQWQIVTPGPAHLRVEVPEAWRAYVRGLRALPRGPARQEGLTALWRSAIESKDAALVAHGVARLSGRGALSEPAVQALAGLALDTSAPITERLRAIRMGGARLPPVALARLLADSDMEVAEAALAVVVEHPERISLRLKERLLALATGEGATPRGVILRVGALAALAADGERRVEGPLAAHVDHRLYKVRLWAIRGLGALAKGGSQVARATLEARRNEEPDPRLVAAIEQVVGRAAPAPRARRVASPGRDLGVRMLLVLLGLACLAGMVLLPRIHPVGPPAR